MSEARPERFAVLRPDAVAETERAVAIETPVAVEVNGIGYAVMMMTPSDLVSFAYGFMLTERLADGPDDIVDAEPVEADAGLILRVTLAPAGAARVGDRVRHRTSDTGCGLCGIAELEQLRRPVRGGRARPDASVAAIFSALERLRAHQPLNALTGAVHGAAACNADGSIDAVYEDVGRHNALDKLVGGLAIRRREPGGFILVTSRISYEMVDKALVADAPMLVGISAPTTLAIDHAREHGLTLLALARPDAILVANDPYGLFG